MKVLLVKTVVKLLEYCEHAHNVVRSIYHGTFFVRFDHTVEGSLVGESLASTKTKDSEQQRHELEFFSKLVDFLVRVN